MAPTIVYRMCVMTRKDSEKDADRPHYYSQFWLDVAAGRRIIGTPRTNEEDDLLEPEPEPEPVVLRKTGRSSKAAIAHPVIEPDVEEEEEEEELDELDEPEYVGSDVNDEIEEEEDLELPAILVEEAEIPDMELDLLPVEEMEEAEVQEPELEEEEFFEPEEDEEEEEEWPARGRKKPKPGRQVKLPSKKPTKREPRRGF